MGKKGAADLLIRIDARGRPLQEQIYAGIRRAIVDGLVTPGTRLPSSRVLAAELGVCRTTSVLALEQLIAEGYLYTRPGSGTYVAHDLPDDVPRARPVRTVSRTRHPPLSARGSALARAKPRAWRLPGPPRPFRMGTPAIDLLPVRLWAQLTNRRLRAASATQFDYGEWPPLREAIAAYLQAARGTRCAAEQVMVVSGTQSGIDLVARLLLDPGDAAWMEEPGYPGARAVLLAAGARIVPVPVDGDGLEVEAGIRRARDARLAYVTPSHQFPLGVVMSVARRTALLEWANAAQAWVVEDDYDSEFRYGTRPLACLHGIDVDGRVIYVGTFSKTLFPTLRLGFLVVPPDLREQMAAARRTLEFQPPILNQAVLADFLAAGHYERHLRRMRSAYRERLDAMREAVERHCGGALRLRPVAAGLHAVADLEGADADRVFHEAAARGVEALPLAMYYAAAPAANALVLGFGPVRPEESGPAMEQIAAAIEAARRATRPAPRVDGLRA